MLERHGGLLWCGCFTPPTGFQGRAGPPRRACSSGPGHGSPIRLDCPGQAASPHLDGPVTPDTGSLRAPPTPLPPRLGLSIGCADPSPEACGHKLRRLFGGGQCDLGAPPLWPLAGLRSQVPAPRLQAQTCSFFWAAWPSQGVGGELGLQTVSIPG